jgi:hypothetical protein
MVLAYGTRKVMLLPLGEMVGNRLREGILLQVPDPGHHHQTLDLLDVFNRTLYIKLLHRYIVDGR